MRWLRFSLRGSHKEHIASVIGLHVHISIYVEQIAHFMHYFPLEFVQVVDNFFISNGKGIEIGRADGSSYFFRSAVNFFRIFSTCRQKSF